MRKICSLCLLFTLFISYGHAQDCPTGINLLPMYGNVKKCPAQIDSDNQFIKVCDEENKDRKQTSNHFVGRGWEYFYKGISDTAMMRFNQAWLLDPTNADVYWGFGILTGMQRNYKESISFFDRSLKLNPTNERVWECAANSYGQLFVETHNMDYLNSSIQYLKSAVKLAPGNARVYAQLTVAYSYFMQKDSARKYISITDKLDPNAINPEVRRIIAGH